MRSQYRRRCVNSSSSIAASMFQSVRSAAGCPGRTRLRLAIFRTLPWLRPPANWGCRLTPMYPCRCGPALPVHRLIPSNTCAISRWTAPPTQSSCTLNDCGGWPISRVSPAISCAVIYTSYSACPPSPIIPSRCAILIAIGVPITAAALLDTTLVSKVSIKINAESTTQGL